MTSKKQIEANKKNALNAGVKTDEGKELVKYNAQTHGILRKGLIKSEQLVFDTLATRLVQELKPESFLEEMLVNRIVILNIRLHRILLAEIESFTGKDLDNIFDENNGFFYKFDTGSLVEGYYSIFQRYETNLEKRIYRAMNQIERLQRIRKGEEIPPPINMDLNSGY